MPPSASGCAFSAAATHPPTTTPLNARKRKEPRDARKRTEVTGFQSTNPCVPFVSVFSVVALSVSESIRVLAHAWNDQPSAVEPLQDRDDVQRENGDPAE